MNFKKKFLSCLLAGTCLCSPSKREKTQGMEMVAGGIALAAFVAVIGYAIYSEYQAAKARKAEINRRNTLLCFTNAPEEVTKIARQLVHKIPCSSIGNSMFDSLLACKNSNDITTWSALVAANSNWRSSTLDSICNTLLAFKIECDVLKEKVKSKRVEEQEEAKLNLEKEKLWQKERIANKKIYSKERENEKDREYDEKKQMRQHVHENIMQDKKHLHEDILQDKQHWHENYQNDKKTWDAGYNAGYQNNYDYY